MQNIRLYYGVNLQEVVCIYNFASAERSGKIPDLTKKGNFPSSVQLHHCCADCAVEAKKPKVSPILHCYVTLPDIS